MRSRFNHNSRAAWLVLRHANFLNQPVINIVALAHENGRQVRVLEIKENSLSTRNALGLKLYVLLQADGDACVVGAGPVLNISDLRDLVSGAVGSLRIPAVLCT